MKLTPSSPADLLQRIFEQAVAAESCVILTLIDGTTMSGIATALDISWVCLRTTHALTSEGREHVHLVRRELIASVAGSYELTDQILETEETSL